MHMHYLGRQPILDTKQSIFGYEFFARQSSLNEAHILDPVLASATVLVSIFSSLGMEEALGGKKGFVNFSSEVMDDDTLALFSKERLVLEIEVNAEPGPKFVERCKSIRAKGYTLALDNFQPNAWNLPLLPLVSFVKINMLDQHAGGLEKVVHTLRQLPVKLIGTRIESHAFAEQCRQLGFDYLQGYYFARPVLLEDRNPGSSKLTVIQILNQLMGGAEIDVLEEGISRDTALSYKLLRYINSAGMGQNYEVSSIRRALVALGRHQLYRWLTLILFAGTSDAPPPALVSLAATRGRLAELLGKHSAVAELRPRDAQDQLFIVGMFSLLETLLNMPLARILQEIKLPETIVAALTQRQGPYGGILSLIDALETGNLAGIGHLLPTLGIDADTLSKLHLEAMAWSANL